MNHRPVKKTDLLAGLPDEWPDDLLPEIQRRVRAGRRKIVVVDDDPLGTQTVHDLPVLTEWPVERLREELANDFPAFYLLTNSRSLPPDRAESVNAEIGRNLVAAARQVGREFTVISRSDSTLRGHFPGEVQALARGLAWDFDAWLIIPFFLEGGRYTIDDVHYVAEGEWLVPAGETEFARDPAFGYRASNLRQWIEEKTGSRVRSQSVGSISIDDIRRGGPKHVAERLEGLRRGSMCIVNAAGMRDLEVFTLGLLTAEAHGRRFLCRTAASFVQVRVGLASHPLLTRDDLALPALGGGSLIVVGSHVPRTTTQVNRLLAEPGIASIEISAKALLDNRREDEILRAADQADEGLRLGRDVVVYTSRELVTGESAESSLSIGRRISNGLVAVVRAIQTRPRYLLAKGGITASDIATGALGVRRALVLGQILPGVPVWRLGPESRRPDMVYIVFPGNVGGPESLAEIVTALGKTPNA